MGNQKSLFTGQTTPWQNEKEQKDKQRSTNHWRYSKTNTQILRHGKKKQKTDLSQLWYIILDLKLIEIYVEKATIFLVEIEQYHSCFQLQFYVPSEKSQTIWTAMI